MQDLVFITLCLLAVILISGYNVVMMNSAKEIEETNRDTIFSGPNRDEG